MVKILQRLIKVSGDKSSSKYFISKKCTVNHFNVCGTLFLPSGRFTCTKDSPFDMLAVLNFCGTASTAKNLPQSLSDFTVLVFFEPPCMYRI